MPPRGFERGGRGSGLCALCFVPEILGGIGGFSGRGNGVVSAGLEKTAGERALILALGLLVLAAEVMNTAVEEVVDYISTEIDPRAKRAKDCGSAAVALTALAGGVAWLVILIG
ncbi:diacylglycerol kinase [Gemmobacter aquarius]|uniref:Diacylglycerol kinase n=1 Tax=Paragemmobacter aquarius TaxID=2169400 RepID=A0A2S0UNA2_9RHOB|nr:diacylglycerol kinase [Gemmobacter aquarius]